MKRQATYWETIFAKHVLDKEPDATTCKEFLQFNKMTNNPTEKMGKRFEQAFHQRKQAYGRQTHEDTQCLKLLEKFQLKPQRDDYTPTRMVKIKE